MPGSWGDSREEVRIAAVHPPGLGADIVGAAAEGDTAISPALKRHTLPHCPKREDHG